MTAVINLLQETNTINKDSIKTFIKILDILQEDSSRLTCEFTVSKTKYKKLVPLINSLPDMKI